jgi:hypothetical protein
MTQCTSIEPVFRVKRCDREEGHDGNHHCDEPLKEGYRWGLVTSWLQTVEELAAIEKVNKKSQQVEIDFKGQVGSGRRVLGLICKKALEEAGYTVIFNPSTEYGLIVEAHPIAGIYGTKG